MSARQQLTAAVPAECAGMRLDQTLAQMFPQFSRSRLSAWVKAGQVQVDGRPRKPREPVAGGEQIVLIAEAEPDVRVTAEPIPLDILYEDAALIVLNKPAGLVVHPGAGNPASTLQNALLHHAPELAALPRAGIVHRLDRQTSGLLVVARTLEAHTDLTRQLAARSVKREYEAIVCGVLTGGGRVEAPIARHSTDRKRMAVREGGGPAVTHYQVLQRFRAHTQAAVQLETGRTHQIRVHFAHIHHPLVGDPVYGRRLLLPKGADESLRETLSGFRRQALHARRLTLCHPTSTEEMRWEAPPPDDFLALRAALAEDARQHAGD